MSVEFRFQNQVVQVNIADMGALKTAVQNRLTARKGFALATINLDHLDKLKRSADFRSAYLQQDFVVADGNPIVWLSRLAGRPVRLLPGSDLVIPLARWAAESATTVALVGSTPESLRAAARELRQRSPGLEIVAEIAPEMGFAPHGPAADKVLEQIAASGAGLVFLALGAPKQEQFAALGRRALPQVGFASIGAGLDFLAGHQTRAPKWVRLLSMEWLWRALSSPRRLGPRYARSLISLPGHALRAMRLRKS